MKLPVSVGNLLIVMAFEMFEVCGPDVCTPIGVVVPVFCGRFCFDPFPTITRRTVVGDAIGRLLLID